MTDHAGRSATAHSDAAGGGKAAGRRAAMTRLFVSDLMLSAAIGIHPHEQERRQPIRVTLDLAIEDWRGPAGAPAPERIDQVIDYETLVAVAHRLVGERHWPLVETLAERLAAELLADPRVGEVRVRLEKLEAFAEAAAVGVEITRHRDDP